MSTRSPVAARRRGPRLLRARPGDRSVVLELMRELYRHEGFRFDRRRAATALAGLLARPRLGEVWLARTDHVVGYLVLTFGYSLEYHGRDAFVDELGVTVDWRGRGIGGRLLRRARQRCRALRVRALHLEVAEANLRATRLYRRLGFRHHGRRRLMTAWLRR